MKIIEEKKLKEMIKKLKAYKNNHTDLNEFYQNLNGDIVCSLQDFSYQKDNEFFDETSFILSVIISIIAHPHIASFDRDEIIRADLAGHIENDSFLMVMKDAKLWREKDTEMVPEEVYYHEHIDEIKIYENIFIGMLINVIESELKKYNEFYISMLPSVDNDDNLMSSEIVDSALHKIERELRKISYIKNTYFYKQIKKCNLQLKKIMPTNILLKDKLYSHCFRYYRKYVSYEDVESLINDFRYYYYFVIINELKNMGAVLDRYENFTNMFFTVNDYRVNLKLNTNKPVINFDVESNGFISKNSLLCVTDRIVTDEIDVDYKTTEIITLWGLFEGYSKDTILDKKYNENELINHWISSKIKEIIVNKNTFEKYCPVCHAKQIEEAKGIYTCAVCNSKYVFKKHQDKDVVWFLRIRRA